MSIIPPPGGEAEAEHFFVFWRHFHLFFFESTCCCETGVVRGGSLAVVGEELAFSAMLPVGHAWAGSTLLTEILCTKCTELEDSLPLRCTEWNLYILGTTSQVFLWYQCVQFSFKCCEKLVCSSERGLLHMQHPDLQTNIAVLFHVTWNFLGL